MFCPLDWGLGHASRDVPLIHEFLRQGADVLIATDGSPACFLSKEFPQLEQVHLQGYGVRYPSKIPLWLGMLLQLPGILRSIRQEHALLKELVTKHRIDLVVSDNRFGCWHKTTPCVYITHQIFIRANLRFLQPLLHTLHMQKIRKFRECWIPDHKQAPGLSGELSHKKTLPANCRFIGPLSRFENPCTSLPPAEIDILAICSGPEPARTCLEEYLLQELAGTGKKIVLLRGKPEETSFLPHRKDGVTILHHASAEEMENFLLEAKLIVSRSGYTTLMELAALGKKALLIPTPGQTEQEYLAQMLEKSGICASCKQGSPQLKEALYKAEQLNGFAGTKQKHDLKHAVKTALGWL